LSTDSFSRALGRLDPANRALLDLSLRRGMRPEEIADLLGTDPESVIVAREQALEHLAIELGMSDVSEIDDVRARLAELPGEAWTPPAEPVETPLAVVDAPEPEPEPEEDPQPEPEHRFERDEPEAARRSRLPLLLTLLAVTAIALIVVLASNGPDDGTNTSAPSKPQPAAAGKPQPAPAAAPRPNAIRLTPIATSAAGASATAALAQGGKRLELDVKGLPDPGDGSYQVWLYDNVIDSRSLTSARDTSFGLDMRLPANASHFRYLDISLEPRDGNPNHSGESVLRVPLAKLSA
jgi:hypothetical protein